MAETPSFQWGESRFDQSTFLGRFRHFLDVIDPSTLFVSEKRLQECVELLDCYKHGTLPPGVTDAQLWKAQKIKQAIVHPDTGEKIFMPFRMSGFIPFGTPVVVGLLLPNQTLLSTVFWQWLNQSHNACVNYCNRNASKPTSASKFIQGYVGAVTSAVSIAVGLSVFIQKARSFSPTTRLLVQRFIPFPAVASANVCNVVLMRHSELSEGIRVLDDNGNVVGTSRVAARHVCASGDGPDQSGPPCANPGAASHHHGCSGKASSPPETTEARPACPQPGVSCCLQPGAPSRHQSLSADVPDPCGSA